MLLSNPISLRSSPRESARAVGSASGVLAAPPLKSKTSRAATGAAMWGLGPISTPLYSDRPTTPVPNKAKNTPGLTRLKNYCNVPGQRDLALAVAALRYPEKRAIAKENGHPAKNYGESPLDKAKCDRIHLIPRATAWETRSEEFILPLNRQRRPPTSDSSPDRCPGA